MAFSLSLKGHEKQPKIFMVFPWVFHGFAQNLRVFMAHENWKINGFFHGFFSVFFMLFPGWHATKNLIRFPIKIPLKSFENSVNLPWINSQDFHGFLVHSENSREECNEFADLLFWRLSLCLSRDSLSCDTRSFKLLKLWKNKNIAKIWIGTFNFHKI